MKIAKRIMLAALICGSGMASYAQDEQAIMRPIRLMFDAMQKGDSAALRNAFHKDAVLFTVINDPATGKASLRKETVLDFQKAIGAPHQDVYNELIWGEKISIDGDFAQVWADYGFYLNTKFHHCGVDAFQLIRTSENRWLIFGLQDTRRTKDCKVPEEVSRRVK